MPRFKEGMTLIPAGSRPKYFRQTAISRALRPEQITSAQFSSKKELQSQSQSQDTSRPSASRSLMASKTASSYLPGRQEIVTFALLLTARGASLMPVGFFTRIKVHRDHSKANSSARP